MTGIIAQSILFEMTDGGCFPARLALAGECDFLMDRDGAVFNEQAQTFELLIKWPGYGPWLKQIRTVDHQTEPRSISRARLVTEVAKLLEKFIEHNKFAVVDPLHAMFKVGPGGIELCHIYIASLDLVSRGSWQPRFVCDCL